MINPPEAGTRTEVGADHEDHSHWLDAVTASLRIRLVFDQARELRLLAEIPDVTGHCRELESDLGRRTPAVTVNCGDDRLLATSYNIWNFV